MRKLLKNLTIPKATLTVFATSLFIVCFENDPFWKEILRATLMDDHMGMVIVSFFIVLVSAFNIFLSAAAFRYLLKPILITAVMLSSVTGFFMSEYGALIDSTMIENVLEANKREILDFTTVSFFSHILIFGIAPSVVLALVPMDYRGWKRDLLWRLGVIALSATLLVGTVYFSYRDLSVFTQQNRQIRLLINPGYPIYSFIQNIVESSQGKRLGEVRLAADAVRATGAGVVQDKPTLFFFVLGETARADRFSLNGYERATNRYTSSSDIINFTQVSSCGTSTADSLRCIFSPLGRNDFSRAAAEHRENLLSLLHRLEVDVLWRDNNTGCKGVCDLVDSETLTDRRDATMCAGYDGCYDEILLDGLESYIKDKQSDQFIVLHQRGSHGPAYYKNTPPWAKEYLPECGPGELRECANSQIRNAYDNTILYTDYFLSKAIELLESNASHYNVALLYVSDHGESLGEGGVYLHGFPYSLAPEEQTHVPMLFWASDDFYRRHELARSCISALTGNQYTHDSVYHTVLPIFDVETSEYDAELDIFSTCRLPSHPALSDQDSDAFDTRMTAVDQSVGSIQ